MKKLISVSILLLFLFSAISSCSKKDNTPAIASTSSILVTTNWRITYFTENGADSTAHYNNIRLTFTAGGAVAISNDILAVNGTWSTYNDDSRDNLLLNFGSSVQLFSALNNDWHIVEKTSTKIRMQDVSGGGSATDYLTIEK